MASPSPAASPRVLASASCLEQPFAVPGRPNQFGAEVMRVFLKGKKDERRQPLQPIGLRGSFHDPIQRAAPLPTRPISSEA